MNWAMAEWAHRIATEHVMTMARSLKWVASECKMQAADVRDSYPAGSPEAHAAQAVLDAIRKRFPEGK